MPELRTARIHTRGNVGAGVTRQLLPLYVNDDGVPIVTHSMLGTFKECPRKTLYKYADRLKPKIGPRPLRRGSWIHTLLETHYSGGDWREAHDQLSLEYDQLFDEEKDVLGDMPVEIDQIMRAYFWHYANDLDWEVIEVEFTIETELPGVGLYRGRVDLLVQTPFGLYVVDHKSHRNLPDISFRLRDAQSALYIWACRQLGYDVVGFIWNYIRYVPSKPVRFNKNGTLSKRQGDTDYYTAYRSIQSQGRDPRDYKELLLPLKRRRYVHGGPQLSPFFKRSTLEKDDAMLAQILREATHTSKRMNRYPFKRRDWVERNNTRACGWCQYRDLCDVELFGGNVRQVLRGFRQGDPLEYYYDIKELEPA